MGQVPYAVVSVSLANIGASVPIKVLANAKISFVGILSIPVGATFALKFGAGGDAIPLTPNWTGLRFAEPHDQGVFSSNTLVQAGDVVLLVGFFQPCGS